MIAVAALVIGAAGGAYLASTKPAPTAGAAPAVAAARASEQAGPGGGNVARTGAGGNAASPAGAESGRGAQAGQPRAKPASTDGAAGAQPRGVNGRVVSADDQRIEIETENGSMPVEISPETKVERIVPSEPGDIAPGERIVVTGQRTDDGRFVATSIRIEAAAE